MIGAGFIAGLRGGGIIEVDVEVRRAPTSGVRAEEWKDGLPADGAVLFCEFDLAKGGVLGGVLLDIASPIQEGRVFGVSIWEPFERVLS